MRLNHTALRVIRERSGFSQAQTATDSGIDRPNYCHIEAGRRKGTVAQIVAIARVLDIPVTAITIPAEAEAAA
jgi:transcriptional regulator with XRE-family HTH domain